MNRNPVVIGVKENQPTALRFAADAALARGVDLHVVHCLEPLIAGDIVLPVDDHLQTAAQATLDSAKDLIDFFEAAPAVTYEISIGSPTAILGEAADKASLVVVGRDEADWAARLLTDKVAERLAKHAHVPVAIVPEWSQTHHTGTGVCVALDGRSPASGPLEFAFIEASRQRRKKLHVIHVPSVSVSLDEMDEVRAEMSEILAGWSEEFPGVEVTRRLVFDETDEGCLDATRDAAMFVLGRETHAGIKGLFGHPILAEIVRRTQCPSVVVPNDWKDD